MLINTGVNVLDDCAKGTNLTELMADGQERVQLSSGNHEMRTKYRFVYIDGLTPELMPDLPTPIDLQRGDQLKLVADKAELEVREVLRRNPKTKKHESFWVNQRIVDEEAALAAEKLAKRAVLDKLR